MKKATYFHAGCPVCVDAERNLAEAIDRSRYDLEIIHLGKDPGRLEEGERAGVKSVPALVIDGAPYHVNFGASLSDLKQPN